jgi:hypothetical protein
MMHSFSKSHQSNRHQYQNLVPGFQQNSFPVVSIGYFSGAGHDLIRDAISGIDIRMLTDN